MKRKYYYQSEYYIFAFPRINFTARAMQSITRPPSAQGLSRRSTT